MSCRCARRWPERVAGRGTPPPSFCEVRQAQSFRLSRQPQARRRRHVLRVSVRPVPAWRFDMPRARRPRNSAPRSKSQSPRARCWPERVAGRGTPPPSLCDCPPAPQPAAVRQLQTRAHVASFCRPRFRNCLAGATPPPRVSSTQLFPAVPRAVSGRPPLAWAGGRAGCFISAITVGFRAVRRVSGCSPAPGAPRASPRFAVSGSARKKEEG